MKRLLLLLLCAAPVWGVTFTKTLSVTVTHATGTSAAQDTTGVKFLVANAVCFTGTPLAPTDSKGNTWTGLTLRTTSSANGKLFYVLNPVVGTGHTFTSTNCSGSEVTFFGAFTWDTAQTLSFDAGTDLGNTASGNTIILPALTPSVADTLLIVGTSINSTIVATIDQSFVIAEHIENTAFEDGILAWRQYPSTSALTVTITYTSGPSSVGYIAGFKLSAATTVVRRRMIS